MRVRRITFSTYAREMWRDVAAGDAIFLVGAGVSMIQPSGLPSGHALKDMAVEGLCTTPRLKAALNKLRQNPRYWGITPEIVFQRFHSSLGTGSLAPFFKVLRYGEPNAVHSLLVDL